MDIESDFVPGTVRLVDLDGSNGGFLHASGDSNIVLVPQPSSDPEDPLNWSRRRKIWGLTMAFVYTWGVGLPCTLHYSLLVDISRDTGITIETLVQGNGLFFLFLGLGCLFWQAIATTWGRRGVYVISTVLLIPLMVWSAHTTTSGSWIAQRILLGVVLSPIESLPEISIADLFFAHERGTMLSMYVFMLFSSNFVSPLIAGWLTIAIGWRWTMYFGAFWAAGAFLIILVGMEETIFSRPTIAGMAPDLARVEQQHNLETVDTMDKELARPSLNNPNPSDTSIIEPASRKKTLHRLRLFTANPEKPTFLNVLEMMWRPLLIIAQFPNIAWAGFIYGINLSWYLLMIGTASPILSAAPYNFSASLVGSVYAGPVIGAAVGCVYAGVFADKFVLWMARRNGGIREPEQRLWLLAFAGLTSCAGLILWGVGASHDIHWVGLVFGLGILIFGVVVGGSIGVSYAVDCFKEISDLSMASIMVVRNVIGFALSYAFTPWINNMGIQDCFITAGFIAMACMLSFLVMVWKGKTLRARCTKRYNHYTSNSASRH